MKRGTFGQTASEHGGTLALAAGICYNPHRLKLADYALMTGKNAPLEELWQQKSRITATTAISSLKGADRVRKRPGVIFGSDGLDGCEHAVFEILSNSIDEAREGHGRVITVTRYQ